MEEGKLAVIGESGKERTWFRPVLIPRGWADLTIAVWAFVLLTIVRFVAEHIQPLWFPLLIAYAAFPLLMTPEGNWSRIGLQRWAVRWPMVIGMIVSVLIKACTIAVLFGALGTTSPNWMLGVAESLRDIPTHPLAVRGIIVFFMVAAPLVEEVFFRMLQSVWRARYGGWSAVIASALLFGFAHIDKYLLPFSLAGVVARLIPVTIYGLVHAWVYHKTKSTYASIVSHLAGNAGEALLLGLFDVPRL
jgi:membrane protease YdiL (CAAX protease family)